MFWSLFLIFALCGIVWTLDLFQKRKHFPPGPVPFPFLGNLLQFNPKKPHKTILAWAKKYGPIITVWLGPQPTIIINDYQLLQEYFLGKNSEIFAGRPENWIFDEFSNGRFGLFTTDGIFWRNQRRFSLHLLRDLGFGRNLMAKKVLKQADVLVSRMRQGLGAKPKGVIDLNRLLQFCLANITGSIIFQKNVVSEEAAFLEFKRNLTNLMSLVVTPEAILLTMCPVLRFIPLFNWFRYYEMKKNATGITEFLEPKIAELKAKFDANLPTTNYVDAYLHKLRRDGSKDGFSEQQLLTTVGELFAAGMEGTGAALSWAILFLITHPSVQEEVHQELDSFYANSTNDSPVSWGDRLSLPYTMATIHEVLRLATILPINFAHTVSADVKVGEYTLPRGTVVIPQMASVHLDPDIFPNPDQFNPNRFLIDKELSKKVIPFSLGKRQCLGESLAKMELFLILTSIFKNFRLSMVDQQNPPSMEPERRVNLVPKPYKVFVHVKH